MNPYANRRCMTCGRGVDENFRCKGCNKSAPMGCHCREQFATPLLWKVIANSTIGRLTEVIVALYIIYWLFSVSLGGTNCQPSIGPIC